MMVGYPPERLSGAYAALVSLLSNTSNATLDPGLCFQARRLLTLHLSQRWV